MLQSLCKKLLSTPSTLKNVIFLPQPQPHSPKFFSKSTIQHQPTISYLVQRFGLSSDSAIKVSQKIKILNTERADSVLHIFQSYGFTQSSITELVKRSPSLVVADPVKTLKPKLEFLESAGYSREDIAQIVYRCSPLLRRSLNNQIIPTFDLLKKFLDHNEILAFFVSMQCGLRCLNFKIVDWNVELLRDHGVPESNIRKLFILNPIAISQENDRFYKIVKMVEGMKFDPSKQSFVHAISVIGGMGTKRWEQKVEAYRRFGWSNEDVVAAFKRQPGCMFTSEEKIEKLMDFYLNKLGLEAASVARHPNAMLVSLEKRLIPRCSVIEVLLSRGLIRKDMNILPAFVLPKKCFDSTYVIKYQDSVPEVLKAYKGEFGYPSLEVLHDFYKKV